MREWRENELTPVTEHALSKDLTLGELRLLLADGVIGEGRFCDDKSREGLAARIRVVKPWAWQLKDLSNIGGLRWEEQRADGSTMGGKLWKLADGDVLLWTASELDTVQTRPAVAAAARPREGGGFRIFSQSERMERAKKQEDEAAKTRRVVEERLAVLQQKWRGRGSDD